MKLTKYQKNVIRTLVPTVIGALLTLAAKNGLDLSNGTVVALMPVITTIYYSAIRKAEETWPHLSWLLGALPADPFHPETKKP